MKLNSKKCTFGVLFEKLVGYMINQEGIEANLDKAKAMLNMKSITMKEVKKLASYVAVFRRFMSRS